MTFQALRWHGTSPRARFKGWQWQGVPGPSDSPGPPPFFRTSAWFWLSTPLQPARPGPAWSSSAAESLGRELQNRSHGVRADEETSRLPFCLSELSVAFLLLQGCVTVLEQSSRFIP